MTNSMKPHRWSAMFAKRRSLWLLWVALVATQVQAENCRMTLSEPRVDYGVIRPAQASSSRALMTLDTPRTLHLSVLCTDPSAMSLRFNGAAADAQGFQFGRQGRFTLNLRQAQVDGRPVSWQSDDTSSGQLLPGAYVVCKRRRYAGDGPSADSPGGGRGSTAGQCPRGDS